MTSAGCPTSAVLGAAFGHRSRGLKGVGGFFFVIPGERLFAHQSTRPRRKRGLHVDEIKCRMIREERFSGGEKGECAAAEVTAVEGNQNFHKVSFNDG